MRNFFAVYEREMKSYFSSPIFYILATVFVVALGSNFRDSFFMFASQTMRELRMAQNYGTGVSLMNVNAVSSGMHTYMDFLFLMIVPLLTMRLYAEEKRNGTMELLMTSPITTTQVLLGKFFSCLSIYTIVMMLSIVFNIILMVYSDGKLDWGPVASAYLGCFLLGGALIAIGIFYSSLTENQIIAAAVTLTTIMVFWLIMYTSRMFSPPISTFVRYLSLNDHMNSFTLGYIGIGHIVYYISMMTFWLVITGITVESARWRQ